MPVHRNRLHQVASSAYNQTVQWAIKSNEDKVEHLWRVYSVSPNKGIKWTRRRWAVGEPPVGVKTFALSFCCWQPQTRSQSGHSEHPQCLSVTHEDSKLRFQHRKKRDHFRIKGKQAHYFDEKQLVCCQLGGEIRLLAKFATGTNFSFSFSFVYTSLDGRLALNRQTTLSPLYQKEITLAKLGNDKTMRAEEKK